MNNLIKIIQDIVSKSSELKNKYTDASMAPVEFGCIFCKSKDEYRELTRSIEKFGEIAEITRSGFTYLLNKPIETIAGPLRLIKIRKPDPKRLERGDADFNTNYTSLKAKYQAGSRFELIRRKDYEYLRLSDPEFDVMTCFSNIPKSEYLGIKL